MDHPFPTKRAEMRRCIDGLSMLSDMTILLNMTTEDHALVMQRRDERVSDEMLKATLTRCASRLGLLAEEAYRLAGEEAPSDTARQWSDFIAKRSPMSRGMPAELERLRRKLSQTREELGATEDLSDSSSYDDYSDSDTESTDSSEEETSDEDDDSVKASPKGRGKKGAPQDKPVTSRRAIGSNPMQLLQRVGKGMRGPRRAKEP